MGSECTEAGWFATMLPHQPYCFLVVSVLTSMGKDHYLPFPDAFSQARISAKNTDQAGFHDQEGTGLS